jgi:hypothetical protein
MIFSDISRGGLYRAFLEEVQDPAISRLEYQGAVFPFTGGLEAGMHRLKIRSNGDIFVGGLGTGEQTNKGWRGTRFGLQKISAIPGDTAFEMLAVRSRRNGMEIEFTRPVGASGGLAANYRAEKWTFRSQECYGCGNKDSRANLTIGTPQLSPDRKRVYLPMTGLQAGDWVVRIVASNIQSQSGDPLLYTETQYTLRAISQTDPFTPVPIHRRLASAMPEWTLRSQTGGVEIRLPASLSGRLEIANIRGERLLARNFRGGETLHLTSPQLGGGVFLAKLITADGVYQKPPFAFNP